MIINYRKVLFPYKKITESLMQYTTNLSNFLYEVSTVLHHCLKVCFILREL